MRLPKSVLFVLLLASTALAGCGGGESDHRALASCTVPQAQAPLKQALADYGALPTVTVSTNLGSFVLELFVSKVPITAKNFLDLADSGFYDGVKFHRVIDGFMIQGGDPNTRNDAARSTWGHGGPGYEIPDEFHPELDHDAAGTLSMANSGANTGGSQFFITLGPTHHLDGKHSIFGRVRSGMETVTEIGSTPTDASDRPSDPVVIQSMSVHRDESQPTPSSPTLELLRGSVQASPGTTARFLLVPQGGSAALVDVELSADATGAPKGTQAEVEDCFALFQLPAGARFAAIAAVHVPSGASPGSSFDVRFRLGDGAGHETSATGRVEVVDQYEGPQAEAGDRIHADYVGLTINAALFDTSILSLAANQSFYQYAPVFTKRADSAYTPLQFNVDGQVIEGFSDAVRGLSAGQTNIERIPPEKGYGTSGSHALAGRTLIFVLDVVQIEPSA